MVINRRHIAVNSGPTRSTLTATDHGSIGRNSINEVALANTTLSLDRGRGARNQDGSLDIDANFVETALAITWNCGWSIDGASLPAVTRRADTLEDGYVSGEVASTLTDTTTTGATGLCALTVDRRVEARRTDCAETSLVRDILRQASTLEANESTSCK